MLRTTTSPGWQPRHLPALDGLRTVAIALVLTYHVLREQDLAWMHGGFVGVDVFFVLSGFLITSLLLREHAQTGTVDLRRFYVRRLWRLYPALVLVSIVAAAALAWSPSSYDYAPGHAWESLVALAYGMSWWSGLELTGGPYLLGLTWSLSVEEHFYLLWPLLLLVLLRRGAGVRSVAVVALLANAWTAGLSAGGADPDRLYFMADTRFAQMLTGCLLAVLLQQQDAPARLARWVGLPALLAAVGWIGVVVVVADRHDGWYWTGGMQLVGVAAAVVVAHLVVHEHGWAGRLLGWRPLVLLGMWSYGIYLWHLPLMRLAQPVLGDTLAVTVVAGLAAVPVAAASYYLVEQPLLRRSARRPVRTPALAAVPLRRPVRPVELAVQQAALARQAA